MLRIQERDGRVNYIPLSDDEVAEFLRLISIFKKNRQCTHDCGNCEFYTESEYGNGECPLDVAERMVELKYNNHNAANGNPRVFYTDMIPFDYSGEEGN